VKVRLLYFAVMRDLFGCPEETLPLAPGTSISELAEILSLRVPGLRGHLPSLAWGVNFEFAERSRRLKDGDEVALLPPVSGGAHA